MGRNRRRRTPDDFVTLLEQSDDRMRALAYSVLGSAKYMDDVLQDAYLKAFRAYDGFRGESSFATWLGSIVYRSCVDHGRSSARRPTIPVPTDELERLVEQRIPQELIDAHLLVEGGLMQLSQDHRAILLLVDLESMTLAEAAIVLGIRPGTAASRLSRARRALRGALVDDQNLVLEDRG